MELAKWLVHWSLTLASRVRCSPRTIYMIHRMTPGKATCDAKIRSLHDKIVCASSAHVLHSSRVLVIAIRSLSCKRRINTSLVTPFLFPSRAGHFLWKIEFKDVLNRYFGVMVPSDYFVKDIRYFLFVTCIRLSNN